MIRFRGHKPDGTKIIGVGIPKETWAKLLNSEIIAIDLAELGVPDTQLLLAGGESDFHITRDFQQLIGSWTKVQVDPSAIKKF